MTILDIISTGSPCQRSRELTKDEIAFEIDQQNEWLDEMTKKEQSARDDEQTTDPQSESAVTSHLVTAQAALKLSAEVATNSRSAATDNVLITRHLLDLSGRIAKNPGKFWQPLDGVYVTRHTIPSLFTRAKDHCRSEEFCFVGEPNRTIRVTPDLFTDPVTAGLIEAIEACGFPCYVLWFNQALSLGDRLLLATSSLHSTTGKNRIVVVCDHLGTITSTYPLMEHNLKTA